MTLQELGSELNPYNECVAKKVVNRKKYAIAWYVDNTKISHVDENVVTQVIEDIEAKFGKTSVTHRNDPLFLGMNITLNKNSTITIIMKDYFEEAI